jgi:hypothetical protein
MAKGGRRDDDPRSKAHVGELGRPARCRGSRAGRIVPRRSCRTRPVFSRGLAPIANKLTGARANCFPLPTGVDPWGRRHLLARPDAGRWRAGLGPVRRSRWRLAGWDPPDGRSEHQWRGAKRRDPPEQTANDYEEQRDSKTWSGSDGARATRRIGDPGTPSVSDPSASSRSEGNDEVPPAPTIDFPRRSVEAGHAVGDVAAELGACNDRLRVRLRPRER